MKPVHIENFRNQRVHMVGVGGASMSGLARMLHIQGYTVSGSDQSEGYALESLRKLGLDVRAGHLPQMVEGTGLLVYSAAIAADDPERAQASILGIPQMERAVLLGQLMEGYQQQICVCGTHGKTTASSMIAQMLVTLKQEPSVHLGGSLDAIGGSIRLGGNHLFVAEACEFNRSFLHMPVSIAVLLNIEEDHLDCYGNMDNVEQAYLDFLSKLPDDGIVIALGEDQRVCRVVGRLEKINRRIVNFGNDRKFDYYFDSLQYDELSRAGFAVYKGQDALCKVHLSVPGKYNALHALAALVVADVLGLPMQASADALGAFTGARRRFEHTGQVKGMEMYHDYGHNPAEMRAALSMAKLQNRRVVAVMQPHTFSRVKTLFDDYLTCTQEADLTLVTDIDPAREKDPGDIHSSMLVAGMQQNGIQAFLTPTFEDTEKWLLANGKPGDLVLTMGCGTIHLLNQQMQQHEATRININDAGV